jgi:ribonuclease P protein component
MKKESFGKNERIRKKKDFDRIYRHGSRIHSKNFMILHASPDTDSAGRKRLGLAIGKKVGKAVVRNKFKRTLREFFRRNKGEISLCGDILIIVRKNTPVLSYRDVCLELGAVLFEPVKK